MHAFRGRWRGPPPPHPPTHPPTHTHTHARTRTRTCTCTRTHTPAAAPPPLLPPGAGQVQGQRARRSGRHRRRRARCGPGTPPPRRAARSLPIRGARRRVPHARLGRPPAPLRLDSAASSRLWPPPHQHQQTQSPPRPGRARRGHSGALPDPRLGRHIHPPLRPHGAHRRRRRARGRAGARARERARLAGLAGRAAREAEASPFWGPGGGRAQRAGMRAPALAASGFLPRHALPWEAGSLRKPPTLLRGGPRRARQVSPGEAARWAALLRAMGRDEAPPARFPLDQALMKAASRRVALAVKARAPRPALLCCAVLC
jgi:hypothetical protein